MMIMISMRDGTKLAADIYLPSGEGPFPAMLARSVYGKGDETYATPFTEQRIAVVIQDVRGLGNSEGKAPLFEADGWGNNQDAADTIEWIKNQEWSNGKIFTWGGSALSFTQVLAAASSKSITCQFIMVAPPGLYHHFTFIGGVWRKNMLEGWLKSLGREEIIALWKSHPADDDFWRNYETTHRAGFITAPAILVGGWWDMYAQGIIDCFVSRQHDGGENARAKQKLIIGPWTHNVTEPPNKVGDIVLKPNQRLDVLELEKRFYRHWLLGEENGAMEEANVRYYTLGALDEGNAPGNLWRTARDWPPLPTNRKSFYLHPQKRLSPETVEHSSEYSFSYNPADPCPTLGGRNYLLPAGPFDQRPISKRADVLRFETEPLNAPLEVTGRVRVELHISSDAPDTDFTAKLVDIYPDGREIILLDGIQRVKFRKGCHKAKLLSPGTVGKIEIDLWSISIVFNRGHKIGLQVSSSNYPHFEVNPNTGDDYPDGVTLRIASNTVYCGKGLSALVLPVVAER